MDNNFVNIDNLFKQRLSGGEVPEPSGAWLRMSELLDKEDDRKPVPFIWRRMFGGVAILVLISALSLGGYKLILKNHGIAGNGVPVATLTASHAASGSHATTAAIYRPIATAMTNVNLAAEPLPTASSATKISDIGQASGQVPKTNNGASTIANASTQNSQRLHNSTNGHGRLSGNLDGYTVIGGKKQHTNNTTAMTPVANTGSQLKTEPGRSTAALAKMHRGNPGGDDLAKGAANSEVGVTGGTSNGGAASLRGRDGSVDRLVPGAAIAAAVVPADVKLPRHEIASASTNNKNKDNKASGNQGNSATRAPNGSNGLAATKHRTADDVNTVPGTGTSHTRGRATVKLEAIPHENGQGHAVASNTAKAGKTNAPSMHGVKTTRSAIPARPGQVTIAERKSIADNTSNSGVNEKGSTGSKSGTRTSGTADLHKLAAAAPKPAKTGIGNAIPKPLVAGGNNNSGTATAHNGANHPANKGKNNSANGANAGVAGSSNANRAGSMSTASRKPSGTKSGSGVTAQVPVPGLPPVARTMQQVVVQQRMLKTGPNTYVLQMDTISMQTVSEEMVAVSDLNVYGPPRSVESIEPGSAMNDAGDVDLTPAAAAAAAENAKALAKKEQFKKKGGGHKMDGLQNAMNDIKYKISGARFATGLKGGINGTFFGPNSFKGFQFGFTGNFILSESVNILAELEYFHRINNDFVLQDNYYTYKQLGPNLWSKQEISAPYSFSTLHSFELPLIFRYTKSKFNFFVGGNISYALAVNEGIGLPVTSNLPANNVTSVGTDNSPKIQAQDFNGRFGLGYLFGVSVQLSPAVSIDLRDVQTFWDNAATPGSKEVSRQLYRSPSFQLSLGYRFGSRKGKDKE